MHFETDVVDQTWHFLYTFASYSGMRLLRGRNIDCSMACCDYLGKLCFIFGILLYCFVLFLSVGLCIPIPENGIVKITLDIHFAVSLTWGAIQLAGLITFITLNHSMEYLSSASNFKDQCVKTRRFSAPSKTIIVGWRRRTIWLMSLFAFLMICFITLAATNAAGITGISYKMERLHYWGRIPAWSGWIFGSIMRGVSAWHIFHYCIFSYNHTNLVQLYFKVYCNKLKDEKAISFSKNRLVLYHAEYNRLIGLIQDLNQAFKLPCFSTIFMATITTCFLLFCFIQGDMQQHGLLSMALLLFGIASIFLFTVIPPVMLDNQVRFSYLFYA